MRAFSLLGYIDIHDSQMEARCMDLFAYLHGSVVAACGGAREELSVPAVPHPCPADPLTLRGLSAVPPGGAAFPAKHPSADSKWTSFAL